MRSSSPAYGWNQQHADRNSAWQNWKPNSIDTADLPAAPASCGIPRRIPEQRPEFRERGCHANSAMLRIYYLNVVPRNHTTIASSGHWWRERAPVGVMMFKSPMKTPARKSDVQGFGSMLIDIPVSKRTGRLGQWASSPGIVT